MEKGGGEGRSHGTGTGYSGRQGTGKVKVDKPYFHFYLLFFPHFILNESCFLDAMIKKSWGYVPVKGGLVPKWIAVSM